jgi:hypothetical protein
MDITCWITKTTNTRSEYVILIVFPRQKWFRDRASMLRLNVLCLSCHRMYSTKEEKKQKGKLRHKYPVESVKSPVYRATSKYGKMGMNQIQFLGLLLKTFYTAAVKTIKPVSLIVKMEQFIYVRNANRCSHEAKYGQTVLQFTYTREEAEHLRFSFRRL